MNNLPQGWQLKTLGEICTINPKNKNLDDDLEISFIPMNKIADKYQNRFSYEVKKWSEVKRGYTHLQNHCIALAKITPCFENGKCVVLENLKNGYGAGSTELIVILPEQKEVLLKFIFYFFHTTNFTKEGVKNLKGTAGQLRINVDFIANTPIPLPPLQTQKLIVKKLENAFTHIDKAISHLNQVSTDIPRLKASLLHYAFSGKLTESNRDISHFSNAQYDKFPCHSERSEESHKLKVSQENTITLTQNQMAFSQYPAFIYILTNKNNTTLYIGVTSNLQKRIYEHKHHLTKGFSDKYNCEKLIYFESFENINQAIEREKYLKGKKRVFKENLINSINPKWFDLYNCLFRDISAFTKPQYDNKDLNCHSNSPTCHTELATCHTELATCHTEPLGEVSQNNRDSSASPQNDKENTLPQGWQLKTLGEVCEQIQKRSKDYKKTEFEYIDISSINNKTNTIEKAERYTIAKAPSRAQQIIQSNDILFSNVRTYLKNIAFVDEKYNDCIASTGFCVIRVKKDILLPKFMFYQALSDKFISPLNSLQRGSNYPAVRNNDVFMQVVVVPPLKTQKQIVQILESKFTHLENLTQFVQQSLDKLHKLKSALLTQAFRGELG